MEYALTENGNIKVTDGKPTVVADGEEIAIDAIGANDRVKDIVTQRDALKADLKKATGKLETYSGIEDPLAAIKAMQDVNSITEKQQVELDTLREEINKAWQLKETAWQDKESDISSRLRKATVERDFATSDTVKNLTIPHDIAYTMFGGQFNDDGTANDVNGNPIYSIENPGKPAIGEEAINLVIKAYANVDQITKANNSGGGGGQGGQGGGSPATITRSEFDSKTPAEQMKFSKDGGKVT